MISVTLLNGFEAPMVIGGRAWPPVPLTAQRACQCTVFDTTHRTREKTKNTRFFGFGGAAPRDLLAHSRTAAAATAATALPPSPQRPPPLNAAAAARRAPPARRLRFDIGVSG